MAINKNRFALTLLVRIEGGVRHYLKHLRADKFGLARLGLVTKILECMIETK